MTLAEVVKIFIACNSKGDCDNCPLYRETCALLTRVEDSAGKIKELVGVK